MKSEKISRNKESFLKEEDFKPENVKMTISLRVSEDLVDAYRAEAEKLGLGYQTLMQMKLREALLKDSLEKRVEAIEKKIKRA